MWTYYISKVGTPGARNPRSKSKAQNVTDARLVKLLIEITGPPTVGAPRVVAIDWNTRWKRLRLIDDKGAHHDLRWKENE